MPTTESVDTRPKRSVWVSVDRWMRSIHLYTGLFLVPWMLVYAVSAFQINHGPAIQKWLDLKPPKPEIVREIQFTPDDTFPNTQDEQAAALLALLDLDGAHRVLPAQSNAEQLKIIRISGSGNHIITWNRVAQKVLVQQQQPFSYLRLINFLHFKGGYGMPYPAHVAWAIVVDIVAVSIIFWVISGVYIWARRPARRVLGGVFLLGGVALFVGLVIALCN